MNEFHPDAPATRRPTLLTVVCVLSFIAGVIGLWTGIRDAFTDAPQEALAEARVAMEEAMAEVGEEGMPMVQDMMESAITLAEKAAEHAREMGYAGMALSLLSLFGVWNMWNLKRSGFWIYLAATVGGLAVPLVFLGGGLMTIISLGIGGFISVVFIALYAVNLKHMH